MSVSVTGDGVVYGYDLAVSDLEEMSSDELLYSPGRTVTEYSDSSNRQRFAPI